MVCLHIKNLLMHSSHSLLIKHYIMPIVLRTRDTEVNKSYSLASKCSRCIFWGIHSNKRFNTISAIIGLIRECYGTSNLRNAYLYKVHTYMSESLFKQFYKVKIAKLMFCLNVVCWIDTLCFPNIQGVRIKRNLIWSSSTLPR